MSSTWEYRVINGEAGRYWDEFYRQLKSTGEEGWELLHVTERPVLESQGQIVHLRAYLRREQGLGAEIKYGGGDVEG